MTDREPDAAAVDLYGRPTAAELVEAVRGFLADDVMAATDGRVQFHARVAVRVLDTVLRELALAAALEPDVRAKLEVADPRYLP